jgi:hypothetical protein
MPAQSPNKAREELAINEIVRRDAAQQCSIHSPTIQPLTRTALAVRVTTPSAGINDELWKDLPEIGGFFTERIEEGTSRATRASVCCDGEHLYVRVFNVGAPGRTTVKKDFWNGDTVEILINPSHDHHNYFHFVLTPGGKQIANKVWKSQGTQRWEARGRTETLVEQKWQGQSFISEAHWTAFFKIPFEVLGGRPEAGQPMGFNVLRQRCSGTWNWFLWSQTHRGPHSPFGFGDLYLDEAPLINVERVDLGEVRLWENRGALHLRNVSGAVIDAELDVVVRNGPKDEHAFYTGMVRAQIPAETPVPFIVPFVFPFDAADYKYQFLKLTLRSKNGQRLWAGGFRCGYETGTMLHTDVRRDGPETQNPEPGDPRFMQKKRDYIMRRLPRFMRKTTAQGAPSDFTLAAEDGSATFDLMRAGALKQMADFIYQRFDNDVDRLIGATLFMHQKAVMAYAHVPSSLANSLNPLSIIRLGNAQCCCSASALLGLLEKMTCAATGKPYRGTRVNVPGHTTTIVEYLGRNVHLDPSIGRFYFLHDDKTLASIEEILAEPSLARRQSPYLEELYSNAANSDAPTFYRSEKGIWPPGAPAE